jgi:AcrR family transcriptional regulator
MSDESLAFYLSEHDAPAKRAILTAALDLFASRGVDGVNIREIAATAGCTNPAMFRHFDSKEALAYALFESCYRRLASGLVAASKRDQPTLRHGLEACLEMIETSPDAVHFVLENLRRYWRDVPADLRKTSLVATMRSIIIAQQKAGTLRASVDPRLATTLVLGTLAQLARMSHFNELQRPASSMADDIWDLITRGIGV